MINAVGYGIGLDVEFVPIEQANDACDKVGKGDVRFRGVIDMATSNHEA